MGTTQFELYRRVRIIDFSNSPLNGLTGVLTDQELPSYTGTLKYQVTIDADKEIDHDRFAWVSHVEYVEEAQSTERPPSPSVDHDEFMSLLTGLGMHTLDTYEVFVYLKKRGVKF